MVRAFSKAVPEETLKADLEHYKQQALELGAAAAEIIPSDWVSVDERVRMKCFVPRCLRVGETPNCPPYTPELDLVRKALSNYKWAILFKVEMDPSDYLPTKGSRRSLDFHGKVGEIVYQIERLAYKDGYDLAMGFGGGSCKDYLCKGMICQFLDAGRCRFPLRARPAMEAMGIDVFDLLNKVGWRAYPLLDDLNQVPYATSVGIIFIQ